MVNIKINIILIFATNVLINIWIGYENIRRELMRKVAKIIAIIGLVLIFSGLIIVLNNKNKELNTQLMEKTDSLESCDIRLIQYQAENEALWDNYYMNVSEYGGEYYE